MSQTHNRPGKCQRNTSEWVTPHIWICHVKHMNESCHTYERVMSQTHDMPGVVSTQHIQIRNAIHMNESCHTHEWVMSHMWVSHVTDTRHARRSVKATRTNISCHTREWVMSHPWMSHVTHAYESCHTYEWVMSQTHDMPGVVSKQDLARALDLFPDPLLVLCVCERVRVCVCVSVWVLSHWWVRHVMHTYTYVEADNARVCVCVYAFVCVCARMQVLGPLYENGATTFGLD